jgi:hypothetical protein
MCITFNSKPERMIAPKGGVICYKELYRCKFIPSWQSIVRYDHYYMDGEKNKPVKITLRYFVYSQKWTGEKGYHSFVKKPKLKCKLNKVVQCLIPAGAVYYKGHNKGKENYISSRIVITDNLRTGKVV